MQKERRSPLRYLTGEEFLRLDPEERLAYIKRVEDYLATLVRDDEHPPGKEPER